MSVFQVRGHTRKDRCGCVVADSRFVRGFVWLLRSAQDIFDVVEIDPTGKKFDKGAGTRTPSAGIRCRCPALTVAGAASPAGSVTVGMQERKL